MEPAPLSPIVAEPPLVAAPADTPAPLEAPESLSADEARPAPSIDTAPVLDATASRAEPATSVKLELAARGLVVFGASPGPSFGAEASFAWLPLNGAFRLELSVMHARSATQALGPARGRFSLTTARLTGCAPGFHLGPATAELCGSVAGGAVWGQGFASGTIASANEVTLPWFDASPLARVGVDLPRGFRIEARGGPTFPINRHTFVFEGPRVAVYTVPPVGFEGGLGLSFAP